MPDPIVETGTPEPPVVGETTTPSPAPATTGAPVAAPATPSNGAPPASATDASRVDWVPSHRLRETREKVLNEARAYIEHLQAQHAREMETLRNQVRVLTGVTPPANPEVQAVREQFGQLYPGLAKLEEKAAAIEDMLSELEELRAMQSYVWNQHRDSNLEHLYSTVEKATGAPLTDEAKQYLHASLLGYVQSSEERANRYATQGRAVVEELARAFIANFVDPLRRSSIAAAADRAAKALPQDRPAGAPQLAQEPKPKDLDERAARAFAVYDTLRKR